MILWFYFYFPNDYRCWMVFHILIDHWYILFREMSIQLLCHYKLFVFLSWSISLKNSEHKPIIRYIISSKLFSPTLVGFFHSLWCSWIIKFSFKSSLSILNFIAHVISIISKKVFITPNSHEDLPVFSPRVWYLQILHLVLWSCFGVNFCAWCDVGVHAHLV